jgi:catechol 2,3-dioxygenase-like lactoylglutathione lyase family enzyme
MAEAAGERRLRPAAGRPSETMARGLDHIVHAVRDLDAAGRSYERLGFTVGARNRHPWGTHNRIVQFPGVFIELLSVEEPDQIHEAAPRVFSFGAFNREFLKSAEGLSMLVLESRNAQADAAAFRASRIGDFEPFSFEREGKRPDGAPVRLGFSLAFARDPATANAGFFVCQQHYPENFWNPAFQQHPNGARAVTGVVLVAENPTDHHIFLSAFVGERALEATSTGVTVHTPRGDIQAMDPTAFRIHFGVEAPDIAAGARIAALRIGVADVAAVRARLASQGVSASEKMGRLIVPPQQAHGAALIFEPSGRA